jgi:hypothetical protein
MGVLVVVSVEVDGQRPSPWIVGDPVARVMNTG